jgi:hypothetical protein
VQDRLAHDRAVHQERTHLDLVYRRLTVVHARPLPPEWVLERAVP